MNQPTESDEFLLLPFVENYYFEGGMTGVLSSRPREAARGGTVKTHLHGKRVCAFLNVTRFKKHFCIRVDVEKEREAVRSYQERGYGVRRPRAWVEKGIMSQTDWEMAWENPAFYRPRD